jgi:MFS family permease
VARDKKTHYRHLRTDGRHNRSRHLLVQKSRNHIIALAIYGVFGVIYMPSVLTIPMELPGMTPETGSLMLAFALGAGNLGGFIGPLIVGYLTDLTGSYLPGFFICCVLSLSLFVGGLLLPETGPNAKKTP